MVILYFFGIFAYVGTEQGIANWISQFLQTYHDIDPQTTGARTVSLFWGMMTAGTVLGLVLLKFVDSRKVLIGFTLASVISLLVALIGNSSTALIAFPLVGFFHFGNVVSNNITCLKFGRITSWFLFRNSRNWNCGGRYSSINCRLAWRYFWIKSGNVLFCFSGSLILVVLDFGQAHLLIMRLSGNLNPHRYKL